MSPPFVSRPPSRSRSVRPWTWVALATLASMLLGTTWAAWSDFVVVSDNRAGAGTLVIEGEDDVQMSLPGRGTTDEATLTVSNVGTTGADVSLALLSEGATGTLCEGYIASDHANDLRLLVDGDDVGPLCEALDTPFTIGTTVAGGSIDVVVGLVLADGALLRWSSRAGTFPLEVRGDQPGGGGFGDFARGGLTVGVGEYVAPLTLPADCPGQIGDYRAFHQLANGNADLDLAALGEVGPAVVVALNGNHDVVGTPQDDCILVGNGTMTVRGGDGDDTIVSAHPNDRARGGGRAQQLDGQRGDDTIVARRGNVGINGGPGQDTCEAATNSNVTIVECESSAFLSTHDAPVSTNRLDVAPLAPESADVTSEPTAKATPTTEAPSTKQTPSTESPSTEQPPSTEELSTEESSTEEPSTEAPSTGAPSTEPSSTEQPPSTEAPATERTTDPAEGVEPSGGGQTEPTEVASDDGPGDPAPGDEPAPPAATEGATETSTTSAPEDGSAPGEVRSEG